MSLSDRYVTGEDAYNAPDHAVANLVPLKLDDEAKTAFGFEGHIQTPLGKVDVYVARLLRYDRGLDQHVALPQQRCWFRVQHLGRVYTRSEQRPASRELTERGAAIVAHWWIQQLFEREGLA